MKKTLYLLGSIILILCCISCEDTNDKETLVDDHLSHLLTSLETIYQDDEQILKMTSEQLKVHGSLQELQTNIQTYVETTDNLDFLFIAKDDDYIIYPELEEEYYTPSDMPWYRQAIINNGLYMSPTYIDFYTNQAVYTMSLAVYDGQDLLGVIGLDRSFPPDLFDFKDQADFDYEICVISHSNTYVYHTEPHNIGEKASESIADGWESKSAQTDFGWSIEIRYKKDN